jgi:hypothetical protein
MNAGMAKTPLPLRIDPDFHCFGCYDPATCPGIDLRTHHCADCVLDDEAEANGGRMLTVPPLEANG